MAALAPLVGEMLGVERAPIEVVDDGAAAQRAHRRRDRLRDRGHRAVRRRDGRAGPVRRHVPSGRVGPDDGRGEALADRRLRHPSTRARPGSRPPSSPGPPDPMSAPAPNALARRGGLAPAFAAVRARLGLVALLFALAGVGWWWTVDQMRGMDDGPVDRPRHARLVPRRLGRDDGRDDVPVGRADGRALLADDAGSGRRSRRCSSPPATCSRGPPPGCVAFARRARPAAGSRATCSPGTAPAAGSPARRCSSPRSTS